jgi:dihydroflavonol-4-reductase
MRVLVTGGTGFVGSHSVAALTAAGHEVRLLVRRSERIPAALAPLGLDGPIDHVVGDVTDAASVERAIAGCDAVLHAAAVYNLDTRTDRETRATNVPGARTVLDAAVAHGCDPIVHVSSTLALLRRGTTASPDSPLTTMRATYTASKAESERIARSLQDEGAPVVIVQPGGVLGPHDPHLSDQMRRLADVLRGRYPMWPSGGYHTVDVRDVARLHVAVMARGLGPRRYAVPGHRLDGPTLFGALRALTGRRLPYVRVPARALLPATRVASAAQRVLPFRVPAEYEGALVCHHDTVIDDSRAREELGIEPRPLAETLGDAVRWLHDAGHIRARHAGRAIDQVAQAPA